MKLLRRLNEKLKEAVVDGKISFSINSYDIMFIVGLVMCIAVLCKG